MSRWIVLLAVLLLAGCASQRGYYYDDGYYGSRSGYAHSRHDGYGYGSYGGTRYYDGAGIGGDYYYGRDYGYRGPGYFDTPYYYSLFWPLNRWSYDPYWYPNYYYGVTFFPRNYFNVGLSWSSGWGGYGSFAYSPYRYGWSDWYYDWQPWYQTYPRYSRHYSRPRFGDSRHEAERLAQLAGVGSRGTAMARSLPWQGGSALQAGPRGRDAVQARDGVRSRGMAQQSRLVEGRDARGMARRPAAASPRQRDGEPMLTPRSRRDVGNRAPGEAAVQPRSRAVEQARYTMRERPAATGSSRARGDGSDGYAVRRGVVMPREQAYRGRGEVARGDAGRDDAGRSYADRGYVERGYVERAAPRRDRGYALRGQELPQPRVELPQSYPGPRGASRNVVAAPAQAWSAPQQPYAPAPRPAPPAERSYEFERSAPAAPVFGGASPRSEGPAGPRRRRGDP